MHYHDDGAGHSSDSRAFYRDHRHQLGDIVNAHVRFPGWDGDGPQTHHLMLADAAGNELWLSGAAAGYTGEAPRLAMEILVDAGFPAEAARRVFTEPDLHLTRPAPGTAEPTIPSDPPEARPAAARTVGSVPSAASAAEQSAEALRLLNHRTQPANGWPGLTEPADAYTTLGALVSAQQRLVQALDQIAGWFSAQADAGRLDVHGGEHDGDPAAAVVDVGWDLHVAADTVHAATTTLQAAHSTSSHLASTGAADTRALDEPDGLQPAGASRTADRVEARAR